MIFPLPIKTKGMEVFMPIYKIIGKIPFIKNLSNKILVMENM